MEKITLSYYLESSRTGNREKYDDFAESKLSSKFFTAPRQKLNRTLSRTEACAETTQQNTNPKLNSNIVTRLAPHLGNTDPATANLHKTLRTIQQIFLQTKHYKLLVSSCIVNQSNSDTLTPNTVRMVLSG